MLNSKVVVKSIKLSSIVGTILNLINNWNFLTPYNFTNVSSAKLILTYLVPFVVSSYSISKTKMELHKGNKLLYDINIRCANCNKTIANVKAGEPIPVCANCQEHAVWEEVN